MSITSVLLNPEYLEELAVVRRLSKSKFFVFLVEAKRSTNFKFALKVFPLKQGISTSFFRKESTVSAISHPNVISIRHTEKSKEFSFNGLTKPVSYVLMEYAPYGDFFDLMNSNPVYLDDKLCRTYFHQLIDGLEHLHSKGFSHLDLKLENLLLGEEFLLKIADFDQSHHQDEEQITSIGTQFYRAPEIIEMNCSNPKAADIFSAGILLFALKTHGKLPQFENQPIEGENLLKLMEDKSDKFWEVQTKLSEKENGFFDSDFKQLFLGMTRTNPVERLTMEEIKNSNWYNGPVYKSDELKALMSRHFL